MFGWRFMFFGLVISGVVAVVDIDAQFDAAATEPVVLARSRFLLAGEAAEGDRTLRRFLFGRRNRRSPRVVVFTCVARFDSEGEDGRSPSKGLMRLREVVRTAKVIHIDERQAADAEATLAALDEADVVGLAGGSSAVWQRCVVGTRLADRLRAFVAGRGAVVVLGAAVDVVGAKVSMRANTKKDGEGKDDDDRNDAREDAELVDGLGLIPRTVVVSGTERPKVRKSLESTIDRHEELVGLGVESDGLLQLDWRFVRAAQGVGIAVVAGNERRPRRVDVVRDRRRIDLMSLLNAADDRRAPVFPTKTPPTPNVTKGTLVIVGGGRLPAGCAERFVELAGGPEAPIVVVPCTSSESLRADPHGVGMFRALGCRNVSVFHTKDRQRANGDEEFLRPLREARGVWFGGGRQWNFVDSYRNTTAHRLMHDVLARGGVIGGSSAGASIQADYLARGNPLGNREIMSEGYERGLGFLAGVAIDQHFAQRDRFADMTALVTAYPQLLGIGIDEQTALFVQGSMAEVSGVGKAHFYDRRRPAVKDVGEVASDGADYESVGHEQRYDLAKRRLVGRWPQAGTTLEETWIFDIETKAGSLRRRLETDAGGKTSWSAKNGRRYDVVDLAPNGETVTFRVVMKTGALVYRLRVDTEAPTPRLTGTVFRERDDEAVATIIGRPLSDVDGK